MKKSWIIALPLILSGCATTPQNYAPEVTLLSFPEIGKITEVSLGEDMLRQGKATVTDGIYLPTENNIQHTVLSSGFYPKIGEDKEYTYHSFQIGNSMNGMGTVRLSGGILFGAATYPQSIRAAKNKQETCVIPNGMGSPSCDTEFPFNRRKKPIISEDNFQQTLIYSGRVGDKVRIGYREASGNIARPAFSNEAEYDLSNSHELAYRGAKIKVIEADNKKIRYVVISNFNTQ